jgi:hypothetical protein
MSRKIFKYTWLQNPAELEILLVISTCCNFLGAELQFSTHSQIFMPLSLPPEWGYVNVPCQTLLEAEKAESPLSSCLSGLSCTSS